MSLITCLTLREVLKYFEFLPCTGSHSGCWEYSGKQNRQKDPPWGLCSSEGYSQQMKCVAHWTEVMRNVWAVVVEGVGRRVQVSVQGRSPQASWHSSNDIDEVRDGVGQAPRNPHLKQGSRVQQIQRVWVLCCTSKVCFMDSNICILISSYGHQYVWFCCL